MGFIQQAPIHVYDYYNPGKRHDVFSLQIAKDYARLYRVHVLSDVSATKFYAPDSESPLLALLCKGSSCQCGAGKIQR